VRPGRLAAWIAVPLLAAQAQATFYRAYEDGREAERGGRWQEALSDYRRAVALRPVPATRVLIYGNNLLLDYYPYARMARCQIELGGIEAAEALLAKSESSGEPASAREGLTRRLADLRAARKPKEILAPAPATPQHSSPVVTPEVPPKLPVPETPQAPAPNTLLPVQPPARARPSLPEPTRAQERSVPPAAPLPVSQGPSEVPPPPPAPQPQSGWGKILPWAALATAGLAALFFVRSRRQPEEPSAFRDPQRLGPYRVERLLGRGGFASTYLARHDLTGERVALKLLHPHRHDDPEFLARFRQEARLGAMLVHPNLVRLVDPGPAAGTPWLAMEYVSGQRLDQKLRAESPLPLPELLAIALEIAQGMASAHSHGIVHRDLKPSNVMLSPEGVKIMDFGISRIMDTETLTTTYAFLGTPLYAAPEAQLKTQVGPAADRYAFGIMLFEMLAGHPPFTGETPFEILDQHRGRAMPNLQALRPDLPPELTSLVTRLCHKAPEDRPEDSEVIHFLERLRAGLSASTAPPPGSPRGSEHA
jgi:hypothetical protein